MILQHIQHDCCYYKYTIGVEHAYRAIIATFFDHMSWNINRSSIFWKIWHTYATADFDKIDVFSETTGLMELYLDGHWKVPRKVSRTKIVNTTGYSLFKIESYGKMFLKNVFRRSCTDETQTVH